MSDVIEKCARAIYAQYWNNHPPRWDNKPEKEKQIYRNCAKAAITAYQEYIGEKGNE